MNIKDIEILFQNELELDKVLDALKTDFDKIDEWKNATRDNLTAIPTEALRAISEVTGAVAGIKIILGVAETEKTNREVRCYETLRIETENAEKKFTSASAERTASLLVASYRRVRNIINAYSEAGEKLISTLQTILKYMGEELKNDRG